MIIVAEITTCKCIWAKLNFCEPTFKMLQPWQTLKPIVLSVGESFK